MSEQQADYGKKDKTVFRVEKNKDNPFVMIDRRPIENPELSWKAKGILAYLLSRPDDWVIRFKDLVKRSPDGPYAVRAAMKELKDAGHLQVIVERENGKVKRWIYKVFEMPLRGNQEVETPQVENLPFNNKNSGTDKDINGVPPDMPIDWKLGHGQEITEQDLRAEQDRKMIDSANLIAMGMGGKTTAAYDIAFAFMKTRQIVLSESKVKGQRKAIKEMLEMKVTPVHVVEATKKLLEANMTVTDLFSVSKTAIALANPAPESSGMNPQGLQVGF